MEDCELASMHGSSFVTMNNDSLSSEYLKYPVPVAHAMTAALCNDYLFLFLQLRASDRICLMFGDYPYMGYDLLSCEDLLRRALVHTCIYFLDAPRDIMLRCSALRLVPK